VTVQVVAGKLMLLDVGVVSGWASEVDEASADKVRVKFRNGSAEAEFEAEFDSGKVKIEIERG
jgi:hypothetical protein